MDRVIAIYFRLIRLSPNADHTTEEAEMFQQVIERKLNGGWLEDEIVSYMLNCEEFDPELEETVALGRMKTIRDAVLARIG